MDLNIVIEESSQRDSDQVIKHKLATCKSLGYTTVALSVIVNLSHSTSIPKPPECKHIAPQNLTVLTRLTAKCTESIQLYKLSKMKETSFYDLVALEPQNIKMLNYIGTGSADLDILSLNLADRMEYSIFKTSYNVIEKRGVCIEINYGPCLLSSSLRRNVICNGQNLAEKTQKNLIFSSGLKESFRLRGPKDAISLGALFMLPQNRCYDAVYSNAKKAINLSKHKKNPAASAIEPEI